MTLYLYTYFKNYSLERFTISSKAPSQGIEAYNNESKGKKHAYFCEELSLEYNYEPSRSDYED